jgi:phospholipase/carboxylesterase
MSGLRPLARDCNTRPTELSDCRGRLARVDSLQLRVDYKSVEARDEESPTGFVQLEQDRGSAVLLTPDEIDPNRRYPLFTVFHGAGRQDEAFAKSFRDEPGRRDAFFLIPRSVEPTWDLIASEARSDLDFLEYAYDLIYRRYPVDPLRQGLIGYSDGASYALSVGLCNPSLFSAVMGWAAGFLVLDPATAEQYRVALPELRPRIYLEYGTHDQLFDFKSVAIPMRDNLQRAGFDVTFSVDEGGRHWPSGTFHTEALDWYFESAGTPG